MPLNVIHDTDFTVAPDVGTVAAGSTLYDGWIDRNGGLYSVSGHRLTSAVGAAGYNDLRQLYRPLAEHGVSQAISVSIAQGLTSSGIGLELRWDGDETFYLCEIDVGGGNLIISTVVAGGGGTSSSISIDGGIQVLHTYSLYFQAVNVSPTTLSAILTDTTSSGSPIVVANITSFIDNTTELQVAGGYAYAAWNSSKSVKELITYSGDLSITSSESIIIVDSPSLAVTLPTPSINKTESITIADSVSVLKTSFITKSEGLTVADVSAITYDLSLFKLDQLSLSDFPIVAPIATLVLASESITVSESRTVNSGALPIVQVADSIVTTDTVSVLPLVMPVITKTESITIAESLGIQRIYSVATTESITVADSNSTTFSVAIPAIADSVFTSENLTLSPPLLPGIVATDAITVGEIYAVGTPSNSLATTADALLITEFVGVVYNIAVKATESITLTESNQRFIGFVISITDSVVLSESILLPALSLTSIAISESIFVGNAWQVNVDNLGAIVQSDSITITDANSTAFVFQVIKSESVAISESIFPTAPVFVAEPPGVEGCIIGEGLSVVVSTIPNRIITTSESLTIGEFIASHQNYQVVIDESLLVAENAFQHPNIFTQIGVKDRVAVAELDGPSWSDDENTWGGSDNTWGMVYQYVFISEQLSVADGVTIADVSAVTQYYNINTREIMIGVTDRVSAFSSYAVSSTDAVVVHENLRANLIFLILCTESTIIGESLAIAELSYVRVNNNLTITESPRVTKTYNVAAVDNITISEQAKLTLVCLMAIQDTMLVMDSVKSMRTTSIAVSDKLSTLESIRVRGVATQGPFEVTAGQITQG